MKRTTTTIRICAFAPLMLTGILLAQAQTGAGAGVESEIELDKRYTDALNGFSLRPPVGFQRRREYSPGRLVSWFHRDKKTGAIDLTLMVLRRTESQTELDIGPYSKMLAQKLADDEEYDVKSTSLVKVDGKEAIDLRGPSKSHKGLWQRQVWVWAHPPKFLVVVAVGPLAHSKKVDATCQAMIDSFKVVDAQAAAAKLLANLKRGADLLASTKDAKLARIFDGQRDWFLLKMKGKDVGYMSVARLRARRDGLDGFEARSVVKLRLPGARARKVQRAQFTTADRNFTRWSDAMIAGVGPRANSISQKGMMQNDVLVCTIGIGGGEEPKTKPLLKAKPFFLPKALGMVLPQLLDLTKPQAYSFATYNAMANELDQRTFSVIGPKEVTIGERKVKCIYATDQTAADAEEAQLWLTPKGELLRMKTAEGLIMEASTEAAVLQRFPGEEANIKSTGR